MSFAAAVVGALGALGLAAGVSGCARPDAQPAPGSVPANATPAPPLTAVLDAAAPAVEARVAEVPDVAIGKLEHPRRLASFFARLAEIEARSASSDVRVVQLGDSHTASDYGTSIVRARLAARFGDGGRGFIPVGEPHKRLFQAGEIVSSGSGFRAREALASDGASGAAALLGPTGVAMEARTAGAFLSSRLSVGADRFEIAYLAQPGGGSFEVLLDGKTAAKVTTSHATPTSAFRAFDAGRGPHVLEIRATGDGAVRVYGVRLDDTAVGTTFDALGINGAQATTPLGWDEAHTTEQLVHVAPALAILAYGTNEAGDPNVTPAQHKDALTALARRVKASPGTACLVLGPPDRGARTLPKLAEIIAAQRAAADASGCAFFDQFAAMGGAGSIARWSRENPARARRDHVHLTRAGYAALADALVADLLAAYVRSKT